MLNIKSLKLHFSKNKGQSIVGLAKFMGVATNTARSRVLSGDCMLSELAQIHQYTGLPYTELIVGADIKNIKPELNDTVVPYSNVEKELRQIIQLQKEQILMLKERVNELTKKK